MTRHAASLAAIRNGVTFEFLVWPALIILLVVSSALTWNSDLPPAFNPMPDGIANVEGIDYPRTLTDAYGYRLVLDEPPRRIVSGMLATDEILLDLIPRDRIAAVTAFATDAGGSNCSEKAQGIPQIPALRVESTLALQPDLILVARFSDAQIVAQLRQCRMPVFCFGKYDSLGDIRRNVLMLGQVVDAVERANRIVMWIDRVVAEVRKRVGNTSKKPRVFYYYLGGTAGKHTIFDELVELVGGRNVAAEAGIAGYKIISPEFALGLSPDAIIVPVAEAAYHDPSNKQLPQFLSDPLWQNLPTGAKRQVHGLPRQHLDSISHHVVKAAVDLAHALYPDRVEPELAEQLYLEIVQEPMEAERGP